MLDGRYRLVRPIARGGMGDVFEAEDARLQRAVAVKIFRSGPAADRARFDKEVTVLAALDHPGLVRVFDAGEHDGDAFVVLELVDGPTLASRVSAAAVPPHEVAQLGRAMADALAYVHAQGVVHRDVTPSNILCGPDGRPRLADFGIAQLVDSTRLTASATTIGTAAYMAPEQVQGHETTAAADVYSLGLVLLELLTGRKAFEGSPHEVAVARLVRPPDTTTDVPGPWRGLLAEMTDRAAPNRPSASEVCRRIDAVLAAAERADVDTGAVPAAVAATETAGVPVAPGLVVANGVDLGPGSDDLTQVVDVGAGRTSVLPVVSAPVAEPSPAIEAVGSLAGRLWVRRWLLAALAVVLLVVVAAAAFGGGDLDTPPPVTEPAAATSTTIAPTTTTSTTEAPVAPAPTPKPEKPGKGKGNDKDDDD